MYLKHNLIVEKCMATKLVVCSKKTYKNGLAIAYGKSLYYINDVETKSLNTAQISKKEMYTFSKTLDKYIK